MNYEQMLGQILDLGTEMISCGGETHRVEDTVFRLLAAEGFRSCNVWVVPSNLQVTATDPDGRTWTQIRNVHGSGVDFEKLDQLNTLSRWACAEHPDSERLAERMETVRSAAPSRAWTSYVGCLLGGWGFALFFGCKFTDSLIAALASLLIVLLVRRLSPREGNPLILNFTVSFLVELFIILTMKLGLCQNADCVTIGVVMLLISGLGATNGLRDLVHLDTLSGLINLSASFTGAIGIALGIALPILLFHDGGGAAVSGLHPNVIVQLFSGSMACVGFAIWFRVRGKKVAYCSLGAFLTWGVYLLSYALLPSDFAATLFASVFCGLFGQIMARVNKTPATIFTTICILTLIPGSSLYYAMYGVVTRNAELSYTKGIALGMTCFGIVLGFMVVEVANRFLWRHPH